MSLKHLEMQKVNFEDESLNIFHKKTKMLDTHFYESTLINLHLNEKLLIESHFINPELPL